MQKLKLSEITKAVHGKLITLVDQCELDAIEIDEVIIDSRRAKENALFIPIVGERFDGHDFIEDVFKNGVEVVLTEKMMEPLNNQIFIKVSDTQEALRDLAEFYLQQMKVKVIGVTGSVGKTSCKDMIASVLATKYNVLKTQGNYNNEIGLPLTVFQIEPTTEIAVLEMGMNHFNEIHNLSKIAKPHYAVITNIGVSHIENLGSREGIRKAKFEIFDFMDTEGKAILNGDNDLLQNVNDMIHQQVISYGMIQSCDAFGTVTTADMNQTVGNISYKGSDFQVQINCPGKHMMYNTLPAVIIGRDLGLTVKEIEEGIKNFIPTKMRLNVYNLNEQVTIIDDVYNASPDSMKAAIETLNGFESEGRKIAILGDMFEMGRFAEEGHREVGSFMSQHPVDLLIGIGKDAKYIIQQAKIDGHEHNMYYETLEEFIDELTNIIKPKDTLLLKASRGMSFEKIIKRIDEVTKR